MPAFASAGAMGALHATKAEPAFALRVERDEGARLWVGRVDGISGAVAHASTLPALLHQMAGSIYDLAEQHDRAEWLDWHGTSLPHQMRGDYW